MAGSPTKKPRGAGLQLEPHQVVLRPLLTEKGTEIANPQNQYAFEVHMQADKADIKTAVEALFDVRVDKVRTQIRKGKPRRYRLRAGRTSDWKRALVTLHKEDRLEFF